MALLLVNPATSFSVDMYFTFSEPCLAKPFAASLKSALSVLSPTHWQSFNVLAKVYCGRVYGFCLPDCVVFVKDDVDILRDALGSLEQVFASSFFESDDLDHSWAFVPLPDLRYADDMDTYWPLLRKRLVSSELCVWYERHGEVQLTPDSDIDSDDEKGVILQIPPVACPPSPEFGAACDSDAAIFHERVPPLVVPSMEDDDVFPSSPPTLVRSDGLYIDLPATPILLDCPACVPYECKCD